MALHSQDIHSRASTSKTRLAYKYIIIGYHPPFFALPPSPHIPSTSLLTQVSCLFTPTTFSSQPARRKEKLVKPSRADHQLESLTPWFLPQFLSTFAHARDVSINRYNRRPLSPSYLISNSLLSLPTRQPDLHHNPHSAPPRTPPHRSPAPMAPIPWSPPQILSPNPALRDVGQLFLAPAAVLPPESPKAADSNA